MEKAKTRGPKLQRMVVSMLANQSEGIADCPKCTYNRWKTRVKGCAYECRTCGTVRGLE